MELIKKQISLNSITRGELSANVGWLREFFITSHAYRYCKRFSSSYWRDEGLAGVINGCSVTLTVPSATVSEDYPSDASYGDCVIISNEAETFNMKYGTLAEAKRAFENGCREMDNGGGKPTHFHLNVLLTEKYEDLGKFTGVGDEKEFGLTGASREVFTAFTDSKVETLKRRTKSHDIDGNELPFVLDDEGNCELPYTIGLPLNVRMDLDGTWLYDIVNEIRFLDADEEVVASKTSGVVTTEDAPGENGIFSIMYEIGRRAYEDESIPEEPGVEHEERYGYKVKPEAFNVDGRIPKTLRYIDINYGTIIGSGWEGASAVLVEGGGKVTGYPNYIFDEAMMGIHDYSESADNVYVERGSSASFEALNLMGQFNSVEEIGRYRNDLFKITKENG